MILDLLVVGIFLIATIRGKVGGFMESLIRFAALIGALVLGVMGTETLTGMLYATNLDELMVDRFSTMAENGALDFSYLVPKVLSDTFGSLGELSLRVSVLHFTNTLITIFAFMLIVILVWLVATVVIRKIRKSRREKGVIGSVDSSVGLLLGAIKGALLVFLLLAFMFPLAGIFIPEKITTLNDLLNNSYIARPLYDINPLLMFMRGLPL